MLSRRLLASLLGMVVGAIVAGGGVVALQWWRAPAVVADHVTASAGSIDMRIGGASELAQWVVPDREGLSVIELVLVAEAPTLPGDVVVRIEAGADAPRRGLTDGEVPSVAPPEWPTTLPPPDRRRILREVRLPAASLPTGGAFATGPGETAARWTAIRFDAVVPSAGTPLLVVVSYPAGGTQAGTRVSTLARFPSSYPRGALYVNGFLAHGTLVVRLANDETNAASVRRVAANAVARLPLGVRWQEIVGILGVTCGILWAVVVAGIVFGRRSHPVRGR